MTRINTNVSSLLAQNVLGRSNANLQQSLTRLSTGLRINSGKDDPAGLIASENLRADIVSVQKAISNSERANQVIATADSALGQVSSLLNDIRGLVTESANTGALSDDQVAANQLQVDSALEALNRIAQTTSFQGRRLLDGSLDFLTTAGTNFSNISELKIDQANLGSTGSVSVDVNVTTAATQAAVQVASIPASITAVQANDGTLTFQTAEVQASGDSSALTNGDVLSITVLDGGTVDGAGGNGISLQFINNGGATAVTFDGSAIVVSADLTTGVASNTIAAAIQAVNGGNDLTVTSDGTANVVAGDVSTENNITSGGVDEVDALISIAPTTTGADFNRTITFVSTVDEGAGAYTVTDNGTTLAISVDDDTAIDLSALATEIETQLDSNDAFDVTFTSTTGDGQFNTTVDTDPTLVDVGGTVAGVTGGGGLANDVVIELSGTDGSEVLTFGAGTTISELVTGINLVSDATGVDAAVNGTTPTTLDLTSTAYGSSAFVDLGVIEDTAAVFADARDDGSDVVASVNGVTATGDGNEATINTSTLDLSASLTAGFTGTASFTITGGGALFQLGPDVVSNQQARLGIGSVNTARLGGVSGNLYELGAGGTYELSSTSLDTAAKIVEEAIDEVTSLRGRLGAFQRTTLESNIAALNDTLINLTDAESTIRDADFAAETANLTRNQILVQSGTTVLSIANSNPQNVLALLR